MTPTLHQTFQAQKQQAEAKYLQYRQPHIYFQDHTKAVETALHTLWADMMGESRGALLAIGGFGRAELYPHSDIDLAIVLSDDFPASELTQVEQFTQALWDLRIKPAIQTGTVAELAELARADLSADTAFLEGRYVCGNPALAQYTLDTLNQQRDMATFTDAKIHEMRQRHAKQPALALEPDLKNGIGGLRDIHLMMWLVRAQGLSTDFRVLHRQHILTHIEAGLLVSGHRTLARLRIELHLVAGREEDRLIFDLQSKIAENLGFTGTPQHNIERLMRDYYRSAKTILQLNHILTPMLRGRVCTEYPRIVHDIDADYYQVNGKVAVRNLKLFEQQPEHIFKIIEIYQQNSELHGIAPQTLRAWWTATQHISPEDFYANPHNRARFIQFFRTGTRLTDILRLLNLYGVLSRYLPRWKDIVGLLQHDLFHVYPVDEHILMVMHHIRRLAHDAHSHELPQATTLMQRFEQKYILYLSALFHDMAKGREGHHEILGVQDARQFAQDHGMPMADADLLAWLVEHHLLLSHVAQKQDIYDPDVIAKFCEQVQSEQRLIALYLLTIADIHGTNPKIWNTWKAQLIDALFETARRHLAGAQDHAPSISHSRQQQATAQLSEKHIPPKQIRQLFQAWGEAYFACHNSDLIAWHTALLVGQEHSPAVHIRPIEPMGTLQILVYMENGERLFTRICRIFGHHGLDIVGARAFVTAHNYILDTFIVRVPEHSDVHDMERISHQVHAELTAFTQGEFTARPVRSKASRRARYLPIAPHVVLRPDPKREGWYTLDITTVNRPHLLADITEVFAKHGVRLHHAKIATLDDRVEDSFLINCPDVDNTLKEWVFQQDLLAQLG